jgi:phospholipid/cholesterol/gamma-HCH transport system ATP-binding protein
VTSLVVSHDMVATFQIAHRIALLHDGRIAAYGTPAELRACSDGYVRHFLDAAL